MRSVVLLVLCASVVGGLGCQRKVTATVTGKVDYDGQVLNSGYITFQVNNLVTRGAEISSDGTYMVAGLPFGSAVVSIYVQEPPSATPEGITPTAIAGTYEENPVLIPRKYESFENSDITLQLAMPEQVFDIHLEKPGRKRRRD